MAVEKRTKEPPWCHWSVSMFEFLSEQTTLHASLDSIDESQTEKFHTVAGFDLKWQNKE